MSRGMPHGVFRRTQLANGIRAGLSMLVAGTFSHSLLAQATDQVDEDQNDTGEEELLEEVIVTGFAGSLRSAQSIKENSEVVVGSITRIGLQPRPAASAHESRPK